MPTNTTLPPFIDSIFKPSGLVFPNNNKLTNSNESIIDDFLVFNPYIHYYPKSPDAQNKQNKTGTGPIFQTDPNEPDYAYRIYFSEIFQEGTPFDRYSEEYRSSGTF